MPAARVSALAITEPSAPRPAITAPSRSLRSGAPAPRARARHDRSHVAVLQGEDVDRALATFCSAMTLSTTCAAVGLADEVSLTVEPGQHLLLICFASFAG